MSHLRKRRLWILGLAVLIGITALEPSAISLLRSSGPKLLFSDQFNGTSLDTSKWNTYLTSRQANGHPWTPPQPLPSGDGSRTACSYAAQYYLSSQVSIDNGLNLTASRTPTSGWCNQTASASTFPWKSGVVSTYDHFQFNGGYVAVTMKAPAGNGMWPGLWMLPAQEEPMGTTLRSICKRAASLLPTRRMIPTPGISTEV